MIYGCIGVSSYRWFAMRSLSRPQCTTEYIALRGGWDPSWYKDLLINDVHGPQLQISLAPLCLSNQQPIVVRASSGITEMNSLMHYSMLLQYTDPYHPDISFYWPIFIGNGLATLYVYSFIRKFALAFLIRNLDRRNWFEYKSVLQTRNSRTYWTMIVCRFLYHFR